VGLRRALLNWLTREEDELADPPPLTGPTDGFSPWTGANQAVQLPPPLPGVSPPVPAPPVRDLPASPEPVGGGWVVGQAELRRAPLELPTFYTPPEPTPAPPPLAASAPSATDLATERRDVREAWDVISDQSDQLVRNFYAELFLALPGEALNMFPSNMTQQREDFGRALVQWVVADDPESMSAHLDQLGADHRKFDVEPRHYEVAGHALVAAWRRLAGSRWTSEHEAAVIGSYTRMATLMIDGAMRHQNEPASWGAQVLEHQRVLRDFAVLRIQPDAPYPYKAGQYLTLEVPSHRREWRQMSIASAPRPDNTFDIQVRAIGSTGVSAALVTNTKPGDRLRLGPPRGNDLVVEPGTVPGGLLCVASGTGAAPIAAVVESILSWPDPPRLYAFVGGRTKYDIYPVSQLNQLIQAGGKWRQVQVHGVVSDDPSYAGYRGRVELIVPTLHNWAQLGVDVLVAGPNPMIATTVTNLAGLGVPLKKIHFDQYDAAA
jgi:NAD(P)H-flavin reductase/hemoglobin-like flavoprotein